MNTIRTAILVTSLIAGATAAQAASYDVSGLITGYSTNPNVITATFTPTAPTFTGTWDVDPTSLVGDASLAPYSVDWALFGNLAGSTSYSTDNYHFDATGAAVSYNAGTRTLTVTNGTLKNTSATYDCSEGSLFCGSSLPTFQLSLILTFTDDTLKSFSGTAVGLNDDGHGSQYQYNWSFNGQTPEVPVPAALWLFSSSLVGLAGVARSRKNI